MPDTKHFIAPFIGGLNTEQSSVQDMPTYTSDELNCIVYPEEIRGRRYGMNIERDGSTYTVVNPIQVSSGYFWKNVGKTPRDFAVFQTDNLLHFYDAATKPFSANKLTATVDLTNYITDTNNFYRYPLRYTVGDGDLIAVSKWMKPVKISFNSGTNTFTVTEVEITYRDTEGVDDGLGIEEQPSVLSYFHKYNLENQGWTNAQINQFYSDKARYPANNLQWFIGKDSSGNYNTEALLKKYFGNTPAPKGHFIINYFDRRRDLESGIFAGSARTATYYCSQIWGYSDRQWHATKINNFSVIVPNSSGTATTCVLNFTVLKTKVDKAAIGNWRGRGTFHIYGLSAGTWTEIYSDTNTFYGPDEVQLSFSTSQYVGVYEQYKITVVFDQNQNGMPDCPGPAEVNCTITLPIAQDGNPFPFEHGLDRVTDVAYMAGKYFYLTGDTVLFSKTVTEGNKGYNECYQDADPTSEEISDVVGTDGGMVKFQTMGDGLALKTFNRGVLVFGRDVVWGLISPYDGRFTATEYDTVELSRAGLIGTHTVVSVANFVYYWSPLGIFRVGVNMQTGSTMVAENISQQTIQSFYNNIPSVCKEYCRAAFDYANNRIYWFYPTSTADLSNLDGVLVLDLNYNAFYVQKISKKHKVTAVFETVNNYEIAPTQYVYADGDVVMAGGIHVIASEQKNIYNRFVAIQHCVVTDDNKITFGDFNSRDFVDWGSESYDSYMVSRPITIAGYSAYGNELKGTYDNKQVPILQSLFKRTEEYPLRTPKTYIAQSGAYIRMRWGWSLNDNSNRWDMEQNAYRPQKDFMNDEYVESRIHIRGRGKAYQIEIRNDGNKDFRLAGLNSLVRSY